MDSQFLTAAIGNLLSPAVLAFVLGVAAVLLRSDLRIPEPVTQAVSLYLLFAIGLKGGVGLRSAPLEQAVLGMAAALALGILIPIAAFALLRLVTKLGAIDRGAVAAHYGSTSLVTFTAAIVFLQNSQIEVPGYAATLLTVLEIPGIVVGILLAQRATATQPNWLPTVHEIVTGKSIVLLVGGLVIGAAIGPRGFEPVAPLFAGLFPGMLVFFLLGLGLEVGARFATVRSAGPGLIVFAVLFPILAGSLGVVIASWLGLGVGAAAVLGVLCASASYIAAPAAIRFSLPQANLAIALTASIAVTFPFNLIVGIPMYNGLAQLLATA
ncbi:MAG: sodium-dependent bicarbonate transport family permease [Agromyces sp.]